MEELRTSRALEEEILNDARRKAERILKNQEKEAEQMRAEREKTLREEQSILEGEFLTRNRELTNEFASVEPLAKKRRRLEYLDREIQRHLDDYFARQDSEARKRMFTALIGRLDSALGKDPLRVEYGGIDESEVRSILAQALPENRNAAIERQPRFSGFVLHSEDGTKRYRATIEEVRDYLLRRHREALVRGLFGKGGPA